MSRFARLFAWVVALTGFGIVLVSGSPGAEPPKTGPGGIIISRETTYLTGPLRADGSVDYLAALNERYAKGVTPENNAAVFLLQAIGPKEIPAATRERVFKLLGMAPLPEKGPYLEEFTDYFERTNPNAERVEDGHVWKADVLALEEHRRVMERPWSKEDSPIAAAWLEENRKQLDLVVAAVKRPRLYIPLVPDEDDCGDMSTTLLPYVQGSRNAARSLCIRAMFRIGSGQADAAWEDLLACHRLARLVSQRSFLVGELVAIAIDGMAAQGDAVLAHEGKLTAAQARRFAADVRRLPPMVKMADKLDWEERLFFLNETQTLATKGWTEYLLRIREAMLIQRAIETAFWLVIDREELAEAARTRRPSWGASLANWIANWLIDWNEPFRRGNRLFDRVVAAHSKPTHAERQAAVAKLERDFAQESQRVANKWVFWRTVLLPGTLGYTLSQLLGQNLVSLSAPAYLPLSAEERNAATQSMVPVLFALAAYRADQGAYPAELTALVPKYLDAIPKDVYSGQPLRYKRKDAGYVIYCVGPNGVDNGGVAAWDEDHGPNDDDIPIRVPAKDKK